MITVRRDKEIHAEEGGWFSARWHFSFGHYHDADQMGVGPLRVCNDDRLVPGAVWPMHPHTDVEGITYVVEGLFGHADSLGGGGTLEPGAIQRMTLGSGALHSERNASQTEPMRFLQFWLLPDTAGLPPASEQRQFTREQRTDRLLKVLGPSSEETDHGVVKVHQDAAVFVARLSPGVVVTHDSGSRRAAYLYVLSGELALGDEVLQTGDAAKLYEEQSIGLQALDTTELILVDVTLDWAPVGVWAGSR